MAQISVHLCVVLSLLYIAYLAHGMAYITLNRPCSAARTPLVISRASLLVRGGSSPGSSSNQNDDLYEILGVPIDASQADIRKAYRRMSLKLHPDKNKAPDAHEQFIKLGRAYETLSNPDKRRHYDSMRRWRTGRRQQQDSQRSSYRERERQRRSSSRQWDPPPRFNSEEYTMDDALRTFRSFWGHAVHVVGEHQLDALLDADSTLALSAKSTWIATVLTHLTMRSNSTATQREERRRSIDAALCAATPVLASTVGRRQAANMLGRGAVILSLLAGSKLVWTTMPRWALRVAGMVTLGCGTLWISQRTPAERKELWKRVNVTVRHVMDRMAGLVGGRERARRFLVALAVVLGLLGLHRVLDMASTTESKSSAG